MAVIKVEPLTKQQAKELHEAAKVINRILAKQWEVLQKDGWKIVEDYSIEKIHNGLYIVIEFCFGDFCVYPCSRKGHWLLEKKYKADDFLQALIHAAGIQIRIDNGEHWKGEDD